MLVAVCAAVVYIGWRLFAPSISHRPLSVSELTPAPAATPPATIAPPTPTPVASPAPAVTPAATPTPVFSPLPVRTPGAGAPRLALIVDDCGQWIDTERGFLALGIPITLSVLPDVPYTGTIAREADAAGKGVMLHLPMETISGLNPGPGKVTTEMTDAQIEAQVDADLAQVPEAKGVNNHEGSKASADPRVMRDVVAALSHHGDLFFIDSRTSPNSVGEQTALAAGLPAASRDVFLDNRADVAYTESQLREAARIARRTGSAIAIGHPRPTTLDAVKAMIPELQADGIVFVLARDLTTSSPPR